MKYFKKQTAVFSLTPVSAVCGTVPLRGELPACSGAKAPARYYRRLEAVLRRHCAALPASAECVTVSCRLFAPDDRLCSVMAAAEVRIHGSQYPFFQDGCVWDCLSGMPLDLAALTGRRFSLRRLWPQLAPRPEPDWLLRTCPDWAEKGRRKIDRRCFFLEADAVVLYLPPMTLGTLLESSFRLPLPTK